MLVRTSLLLLILGGGLATPHAVASDVEVSMIDAIEAEVPVWPRWRGPSGQGLVAGSGYVDRWSTEDNVVWKIDVPGDGNSSPVVWDERIFLTTAYDGGARRSVLAFGRDDGALLWEVEAPPAKPESTFPKNGHASSTPSTDGERVYAYFGNHGLIAVDLDGEVAWHRGLGAIEAYHGTASSPLLYRDRVILVQDHRGPSGSFIAAFDKGTGRELWRTARDAQVGWNSPVAVRVGERDLVVMSGQQQVIAYDPENGDEVWSVGGNTFEVIPTPVVGHDLIFCSSGRAGPTLAIDATTGGEPKVVWSSPKGSPFVPAPIVVGDYLYMVNDMASILTVYRAVTGEVLWQQRLGTAAREGFSSAPVAVDGKVFFTNDQGETFVIKQGPDFELLHVNRLDERVIASPAAVEGTWYYRTAGKLYAIGSG